MAYSYDPLFAADPSNAANVAANASIIIFDPNDPGKAPVTITDVTGSPLPNPITVNKNGFGPAFQHATLDRVGWFGAGFTGYFTSYEGMKAEATEAKEAAQAAGVTAGTAAVAEVAALIATGAFRGDPGTNGLNGANVLPTQQAIEQAIINDGPAKAALSAAILDSVEAAPKARISALAPFRPWAETFPLEANTTKLAGWGSSTIAAWASSLATMAGGFGATYFDGGSPGETAEQVAGRLGSVPLTFTSSAGKVPSTGWVAMTCQNATPSIGFKPTTGTLAGVAGTLSSNGTLWTFTRTTPGIEAKITAGTPFYPDHNFRDAVTLLQMGKNNISDTDLDSYKTAIEYTDRSFDWLAPQVKRCIVVGEFCNRDWAANDPRREMVLKVNKARRERYGVLYFDTQDYLTSAQIWIDAGITPTQADLDAQAIGNKPPSLSFDNSHLNTPGSAAILKRLEAHIEYLNLLNRPAPALASGLLWEHDADTLGTVGSTVTAWNSSAGSLGAEADLDLVSATTSRRPVVADGPGGHKALRLTDSLSTYIRTDNFTVPVSGPVTYAFVINITNPASTSRFLVGGGMVSTTPHHLATIVNPSGTTYMTTQVVSSEVVGAVPATGGYKVLIMTFDGANSLFEIGNSVTHGTTGTGATANLPRLVLGANSALDGSSALSADIAYHAAWNRRLTYGERVQLLANMNTKYGV